MLEGRHKKLKDLLYNNKWIADYEEEDPLVTMYFSDLVDLLDYYICINTKSKSVTLT